MPVRIRNKTCYSVELFSLFSQTFFGTNFDDQNKSNVVETTSCFHDQLSEKYCVYEHYVSEHLKYCTQINENLLDKTVCWNMVLDSLNNNYDNFSPI